MTRTSKQEERRNKSPRKYRPPSPKTGPKKDNLDAGSYKTQVYALSGDIAKTAFIPQPIKRS